MYVNMNIWIQLWGRYTYVSLLKIRTGIIYVVGMFDDNKVIIQFYKYNFYESIECRESWQSGSLYVIYMYRICCPLCFYRHGLGRKTTGGDLSPGSRKTMTGMPSQPPGQQPQVQQPPPFGQQRPKKTVCIHIHVVCQHPVLYSGPRKQFVFIFMLFVNTLSCTAAQENNLCWYSCCLSTLCLVQRPKKTVCIDIHVVCQHPVMYSGPRKQFVLIFMLFVNTLSCTAAQENSLCWYSCCLSTLCLVQRPKKTVCIDIHVVCQHPVLYSGPRKQFVLIFMLFVNTLSCTAAQENSLCWYSCCMSGMLPFVQQQHKKIVYVHISNLFGKYNKDILYSYSQRSIYGLYNKLAPFFQWFKEFSRDKKLQPILYLKLFFSSHDNRFSCPVTSLLHISPLSCYILFKMRKNRRFLPNLCLHLLS